MFSLPFLSLSSLSLSPSLSRCVVDLVDLVDLVVVRRAFIEEARRAFILFFFFLNSFSGDFLSSSSLKRTMRERVWHARLSAARSDGV